MSRDKFPKIVEALGTGKRLAELRHSKGLSLTALAHTLGFHSASTVLNYEKGRRLPEESTLQKLAELYGVSMKWILTGHDVASNRGDSQEDLGRKEKRLLTEIDALLRTGDQIVVQHLRRQVELLKEAVANRQRKKA